MRVVGQCNIQQTCVHIWEVAVEQNRKRIDACQSRKCVTVGIVQQSGMSFDFSLSRTSNLDRRIALQPEVVNDNR